MNNNYIWYAYHKDGTVLNEIDNMFKDIDLDNLDKFMIQKKDELIGVDLNKGIFISNNEPIDFDGFSELNREYKLIYFKRNIIVLTDVPEKRKTTTPFVGLYFIDSENNKQEIVLEIQKGVYIIHANKKLE